MCAATAVQSVSERKMLMGRKAILNFIVYQSVTIRKDSGESGLSCPDSVSRLQNYHIFPEQTYKNPIIIIIFAT